MIVLHIPVCPFSQRLEILLELKGRRQEVEFRTVDITRPRDPALLIVPKILPQSVAADTANLTDQTVGQIQAFQPKRLQLALHLGMGMLEPLLCQGFFIFKPEFQLDHSRCRTLDHNLPPRAPFCNGPNAQFVTASSIDSCRPPGRPR